MQNSARDAVPCSQDAQAVSSREQKIERHRVTVGHEPNKTRVFSCLSRRARGTLHFRWPVVLSSTQRRSFFCFPFKTRPEPSCVSLISNRQCETNTLQRRVMKKRNYCSGERLECSSFALALNRTAGLGLFAYRATHGFRRFCPPKSPVMTVFAFFPPLRPPRKKNGTSRGCFRFKSGLISIFSAPNG